MSQGFNAIGEHTGAGHNHNLVVTFSCESPGSEGPEHRRPNMNYKIIIPIDLATVYLFGSLKRVDSSLENIVEIEPPVIRPYLGVLDPTSYTHSGFRLELQEICFPMLTLLKLVDLSRPFVADDLEPTDVW
ncbi:hypothetical protein M5K25_024554 [Dendrobium thyrsiflorum]|uniref:Uncharacterized protein n=1 Tax=Dendrobium thyrsiflorum TaxID=117978 RepID=A0ABD0U2G6_DENTH